MGSQNISPSLENVPSSFVQFALADKLINLCRANSLWPLTFGIACCAIEMMCTGAARFDLSRFGAEVFRPSPRQSDVMIVAGTISKKMAPGIKTLYDQMPEPKWWMVRGNWVMACGSVGGEGQYGIVEGADQILPVDIYVPGCPPRPEALIEGIIELEHKITGWRRWPKVKPEWRETPEA